MAPTLLAIERVYRSRLHYRRSSSWGAWGEQVQSTWLRVVPRWRSLHCCSQTPCGLGYGGRRQQGQDRLCFWPAAAAPSFMGGACRGAPACMWTLAPTAHFTRVHPRIAAEKSFWSVYRASLAGRSLLSSCARPVDSYLTWQLLLERHGPVLPHLDGSRLINLWAE